METYYISPTGNDTTGDGSSGNPWLTVNKAYTTSGAGDTIVCKDGTYSDWIPGPFSDRIITAENYGLAIFDGGGAAKTITFGATDKTTKVVGIKFYNAICAASSPLFIMGGGLTATNEFNDCIFDALTLNGDAGGSYGGLCGRPVGSPSTNFNVTIQSCLIHDIGRGAGTYSPLLVTKSGAEQYIYFYNNTIFLFTEANPIFGIVVSGSASGGIFIKNSIFYNDSGSAIVFASGTPTFDNNCTYSSGAGSWTSLPTGSDNITSDPLFVDAANGNFNLRPTSPCLDTGGLI